MELKPNMTPAEKAAYIEELDRLEQIGCSIGSKKHLMESIERRNKRAQEKLKAESKEV